MTLALPCASLFMFHSLERCGRKRTAITACFLAGMFAIGFVNTTSEGMLLAVGFGMIFFIQLSGNSMQIFASEVFPTNARAPGCGIAQGTGRLSAACTVLAILWVPHGFGIGAVFGSVAVLLVIAACTGAMLGPEARGLSLDELALPTG